MNYSSNLMCDEMKMMEKIEMMHEEMKMLSEKIQAIAQQLKLTFKYTPETWELVKPEETPMPPAPEMPMRVR